MSIRTACARGAPLVACLAGFLLMPAAAQDWLPRPAIPPLRGYESVPGLYYFTDRGNFRPAGPGVRPVFGEALTGGPAIDFGPRLALTFDDVHFGPSLDRLLDILAARGIPAVFFLSASHMSGADEATICRQLKRMLAEGHEIGNHTAFHPDLDAPLFGRGSLEPTREAFAGLERLVDRHLGKHCPVRYLRPPFGVRGNDGRGIGERMSLPGRVDALCGETGQLIILWHINSLDFQLFASPGSQERLDLRGVAAACSQRIAESRGGVVLFHANDRTPAVLAAVLNDLAGPRARAWRFVTVAELLEVKYGRPWLEAWAWRHGGAWR